MILNTGDPVFDGPGLYIHVPFCLSVCPYCDFAVLIGGAERRATYVDALEQEAGHYCGDDWQFDTVYLGGGTPSSLELSQLQSTLMSLREMLHVRSDAWLYLEANPEDVTPEAAAGWKELGIETISLGVQSFDDRVLAFLGRRHDRKGAILAVETLKEAGFHTVSIDLIYGFDGQDRPVWQNQLETAVALGVDHLSCYQLTFHSGTVFGRRLERGQLHAIDGEDQADLFLATHRHLAEAGYEGYEVCSFSAAPRHRSKHNQKYWRHTPYLGLGPSAHSFSGDRRWWNRAKLRLWGRDLERGIRPVEGEERLSTAQLLLETVMLSLRTSDGLDLREIDKRFGVDLRATDAQWIEELLDQALVVDVGDRLVPTVEGFAVADSMARGFDFGEG